MAMHTVVEAMLSALPRELREGILITTGTMHQMFLHNSTLNRQNNGRYADGSVSKPNYDTPNGGYTPHAAPQEVRDYAIRGLGMGPPNSRIHRVRSNSAFH
ncbi:MAG: hypothetical protein HY362_01715 [Candidatus Aenigmarchaeota archaeon]|nr:hypothetical protein [Candidatus Aenigmarchaeota archaeon]